MHFKECPPALVRCQCRAGERGGGELFLQVSAAAAAAAVRTEPQASRAREGEPGRVSQGG
eukprot:1435068-Pyramimonas_sp.AAC.1